MEGWYVMNDKNENNQKVEELFRMRRISLILLYSSIGVLFFAYVFSNVSSLATGIIFTISVMCFGAFIVISLVFWKCPFCGERFEIRHSKNDKMTYCPSCGRELK